MTVSGFNISFDYSYCLPTLSDQAVNLFSANDFAFDPRLHLLSYHRCRPCFSPHQAVNISSIDKSIDRRSCSTSLFTCSQTFVGADTFWSHKFCLRYSYNSYHPLNIADSLKTMNQELFRLKDWDLPTVSNPQKKFAELPIIDISIIGAVTFNMLM